MTSSIKLPNMAPIGPDPVPAQRPFYRSLYFVVLVAIVCGAVFGHLYPAQAVQFKPLSDVFIKFLRMILPPLIFTTVILGIGSMRDMRQVGRAGAKALLYFEIGTTAALLIGLAVVHLVRPGAGMNINVSALGTKELATFTKTAEKMNVIDYLTNLVPTSAAEPFTSNDIMQVLLIAVLIGLAVGALGHRTEMIHQFLEQFCKVLFKVVGYVMYFAPLAAFGAMAFTIGKFGIGTLTSLAWLIGCFYITSLIFVLVVLGAVAWFTGFSIWKFLAYIKEELLLVLGCSTAEPALPGLMQKLEGMGCSRSIVSFVLPAGYSFNLDGACIYLTMSFVFIAQATNTHLTWTQELYMLGVLLLTSKGAAGVPGAGFVTLAATLTVTQTVPLAGLTLLLGVDRFMSEVRSLVNLCGNGVATIVVARWEGEVDMDKARRVLNGEVLFQDDISALEPADAGGVHPLGGVPSTHVPAKEVVGVS